jgi:hypothetical protein
VQSFPGLLLDVTDNLLTFMLEKIRVGAGEASIWTLASVADFCQFAHSMYQNFVSTLEVKGRSGSSVVDMSILWLYWVAHHKDQSPDWDTGRPFHTWNPKGDKQFVEDLRSKADAAFTYAKSLSMPSVNTSITICNGMDVVNRTVMDHMHGWQSGHGFSLDLAGDGRPYTIAASLSYGGHPESLDEEALKVLEESRLYVNNIHFQVRSASYIR